MSFTPESGIISDKIRVDAALLDANLLAENTLSDLQFHKGQRQAEPNAFDLHSEYQAKIQDSTISVGIVRSQKAFEAIYKLREVVYRQEGMSYLIHSHDSPDPIDHSSFIFYCRRGEDILASCRFTKAVNDIWESEPITQAASLVPLPKDNLLQIGRLLVEPNSRSQMLSEVMIWAACDWLLSTINDVPYYAVCRPALARFYSHFGAKSVENTNVILPGRKSKSYRVIYGSVGHTTHALYHYLLSKEIQLKYPEESSFYPVLNAS